MGQLDGKVAAVTGATSGIGERIAELFVAEGARVVAAGRRVEEGKALESRCGKALRFIRIDVTVEADVKAMIDHAVTSFGRLDCVVNNAGTSSPLTQVMTSAVATLASPSQGPRSAAANIRTPPIKRAGVRRPA